MESGLDVRMGSQRWLKPFGLKLERWCCHQLTWEGPCRSRFGEKSRRLILQVQCQVLSQTLG